LARYLVATGWIAPAEVGEVGGLWRHPQSDYLLPVPNKLVADGIDWHMITERLAIVEDAEITDVLARLDGQSVDIANLRAANDIVIRDTIPYPAGVTLVRESWTMLRAIATTSLGPQAFIRNYRRSADEIVAEARMAHTRKGSFIIPIHLPIPEPDADGEEQHDAEPMIEGLEIRSAAEPAQRRVMRTFAESLATIDTLAVQPDREPTGDLIHDLIRAGVSYQFSSALNRVLAEDSVEEFSANFEWAPSGGPPPRGLDNIGIPAAARERVKMVADRLKATPSARVEEEFVGPIRRVERHLDADTGTVTVQTIRNGHPARVSVDVSPALLDQAWTWARERKTVVVQSRVHRTNEGLMADALDAVMPLMLQLPSGDGE
jgi:hypothetical protein